MNNYIKNMKPSNKKKIYVLSSVYPSKYGSIGATPIVHYFAREWVKLGYDVHVFHITSSFPEIFYFVAKLFRNKIASYVGCDVATVTPRQYDEVRDGVIISHLITKKYRPHTLISKKETNKIINHILNYCDNHGLPDYFIGHWDIPQLEIMPELKKRTKVKIALVLHNNTFDYEKVHGADAKEKLETFDAIGFRNTSSKENYIKKYGTPKHTFMAYSGINEAFIHASNGFEKKITPLKMKNFIYVGTLIKRKYPAAILKALNKVYPDGDFKMTYIGEGAERYNIEKVTNKGELVFTGRINRDEIIHHLKEADVFIMISREELFGLVYLEAMSLGCIPIASRNEGIDGIVKDGYNGFLCEAGNVEELENIIRRINAMSDSERSKLSNSAKETAQQFSDSNVAKLYIEDINTSL